MRTLKIAGLILIAWLGWQSWSLRELDQPRGTLAAEAPRQTAVESTPITVGSYTLLPRASFEIEARILARERYRSGRESELSPIDLTLGWGPMSDTAVLEHIEISQGNRFYFWRTENPPISLQAIARHSANMHMIPADDAVRDQLLALRKGQVVRIEATLVDVEAADGWRWKTSLTREDTGAGACELMRVARVEVLR